MKISLVRSCAWSPYSPRVCAGPVKRLVFGRYDEKPLVGGTDLYGTAVCDKHATTLVGAVDAHWSAPRSSFIVTEREQAARYAGVSI
jgi:hypothetical protein